MVIRGPNNAKIHEEFDFSYQNPTKMTYCTTFSDSCLEKAGFPRWHLAAIYDMVIWGPQNAKLLCEIDPSYQKTSRTTYCQTFCDNYLKS